MVIPVAGRDPYHFAGYKENDGHVWVRSCKASMDKMHLDGNKEVTAMHTVDLDSSDTGGRRRSQSLKKMFSIGRKTKA